MILAYIRVSTDKQSVENQRFEILKYADQKKWQIDQWVEETISGTTKMEKRELREIIDKLRPKDTLLVTELSRLGRNLLEIMGLLNECMQKEIQVLSIKEGYELGNNINSKVLAFAFSLSAEIEAQLISQRTKEALARKKKEGHILGRPKGSRNKQNKLSNNALEIETLIKNKVSISAIGRLFQVHRHTVSNFIQSKHTEAKK